MNIIVIAKTRSKKANITKIDDKNYVIAVTEEPHDGKANIAIIKVLAKYFNVAQSCIKIKLGKTGKKKIVIINQ